MKEKVRKRVVARGGQKSTHVPVNDKGRTKTSYPDLSFGVRLFILIIIVSSVLVFLFYPDISHYWKLMRRSDPHSDLTNSRFNDNEFTQQNQPNSPPPDGDKDLFKSRSEHIREPIREKDNNLRSKEIAKPVIEKETEERHNDPFESEETDVEDALSDPDPTPIELTQEALEQSNDLPPSQRSSDESEAIPIKLTPESAPRPDKPPAPKRSKRSPEKTSSSEQGKSDLPKEVREFKATYLKKITKKKKVPTATLR